MNRKRRESPLKTGTGIARGAAMFLGIYTLAGVVVSRLNPHLDLNLWWIDLRSIARPVACAGLVFFSVGMLLFGFRWLRGTWLRYAAAMLTLVFAMWTAANTAMVWKLALKGIIETGSWIPVSCVMTILLLWIARAILVRSGDRPVGSIGMAASILACACVFPILQVIGFGKTDYQRRSDVGVVFGARVYANGQLSDAVADRVTTAVALFKRGLVRELVMSGGHGDGVIHEAEAMKQRAIELGVPAEAISLDLNGVNTAATVRNTRATHAGSRVIAVSEFYHLPRIKMAYAAAGMDVITVPAHARHWARNWPVRNIVREVPAFWLYLGRAATSRV